MANLRGVVSHLLDGRVSIFQYADDMTLFVGQGLEKARNLKLLL